uniref:Uncharacterized protein n=1 Tax=Timema cristinae TaxID=61476 RepID=A0A7R9CLG7_TIMCR|nr:unnamed protein product [Timema cristinae]
MLDDSSQQKGLVVGNDEVAVWTYANLSANTQERIKRFERETKAMLQRDLSRQRRDMEKHEADKKRIEQELQQAKKDLESEDLLDAIADNPSDITKNISDTISHTGVSSRKPPTRDIKYNLSTIGRRLSSSSLLSTSSNTSFSSNASHVSVRSTPLQNSSSHAAMDQMDLSTKGSPLLGFTQTKKLGTTHFFPEAPRGPNPVTISPRNSLPSSGYSSSTLVGTRNVQQTPNRSSTRSHSSVSTVRVSLPGPEQQSLQRSGSVENLQTQLNKLTHNGTLKRMKTGNEQLEPQPNLTRSLRCGSLDSLHEVFGNEGKDRPPSDISDDDKSSSCTLLVVEVVVLVMHVSLPLLGGSLTPFTPTTTGRRRVPTYGASYHIYIHKPQSAGPQPLEPGASSFLHQKP